MRAVSCWQFVAIASTLVILAGCADSDPAASTAGSTQAEQPTEGTTSTEPVSDPLCEEQVGAFVTALQELDSRLNVGMNFERYSETVSDLQVAYDQLPVGEMTPECLDQVAVPAERAFNAYIRAYNVWNRCVSNIDCTNASIKKRLQRQWANASFAILEADASLEMVSLER